MDGFLPNSPATTTASSHYEKMPSKELTQAALDASNAALIGFIYDRVLLLNLAAVEILGIDRSGLPDPVSICGLLEASVNLTASAVIRVRAALSANEQGLSRETYVVTDIALTNNRSIAIKVEPLSDGSRLATLNWQVEDPRRAPNPRIDGLTGLSDREWFRERLNARLVGSDEPDPVAVLMIDLDQFKAVNDSHGHPIGDALLQVVAKRLRSSVPEGDVVSRLGGDEFAIATSNMSAPKLMAERLVDLLSRPYLVEGHVANIGASIGVAIGPEDGKDAAELIRAADLALYQAKEDGRGKVRFFNPELDARARARHALLDDLRRALALHQFEVHYQPQTNLSSGELIGFEALVRWRHPEHGLIPPDRFIPLAEEMGLIVGIGEWVLRTACHDAMSWPGQLSVAVNVSAVQLADQNRLPRVVQAALADAGLPPQRLEVEITESALVRHEKEALHVLSALRQMGVKVSMDDFGTGYSSLSQLRSFPFDKLKIDRSFIRDLSNSDEAVAVIRAIAALGASLGMTTTAEGVETEAQRETVRLDGCTDMQGYLVSRPVPADQVISLVQTFLENTQ